MQSARRAERLAERRAERRQPERRERDAGPQRARAHEEAPAAKNERPVESAEAAGSTARKPAGPEGTGLGTQTASMQVEGGERPTEGAAPQPPVRPGQTLASPRAGEVAAAPGLQAEGAPPGLEPAVAQPLPNAPAQAVTPPVPLPQTAPAPPPAGSSGGSLSPLATALEGGPALSPEGASPEPLPADEGAPAEPARVEGLRGTSVERPAGHQPTVPESARAQEVAPRAEATRPEAPRPAAHEAAADILRQVRLQLAPELRQATIQLEPASLGRLDIRLEVRKGRVRAELTVERGETLQTLERHVPELRASLAAAGFEQAELSLSLAQQGGDGAHEAPPRGSQRAGQQPAAASTLQDTVARRIAHDGVVDTYA